MLFLKGEFPKKCVLQDFSHLRRLSQPRNIKTSKQFAKPFSENKNCCSNGSNDIVHVLNEPENFPSSPFAYFMTSKIFLRSARLYVMCILPSSWDIPRLPPRKCVTNLKDFRKFTAWQSFPSQRNKASGKTRRNQ